MERFTNRNSCWRIESADGGFSVTKPRYGVGMPVSVDSSDAHAFSCSTYGVGGCGLNSTHAQRVTLSVVLAARERY